MVGYTKESRIAASLKRSENENHIDYEREYRVCKWFIDFAFINKKIAIEIDGKQHEYRQHLDNEKDNFLISNGWVVLRIKWFNPINDENKLNLYSQIENMKNLLNSL